MPNVAGKKFPYTKAGIAAAKKMADKKVKVVGQSRSILSPYGRDEYLDHFNGLIKKGMSHKSAHSATIKFMMDSSAFEMQERNSD